MAPQLNIPAGGQEWSLIVLIQPLTQPLHGGLTQTT